MFYDNLKFNDIFKNYNFIKKYNINKYSLKKDYNLISWFPSSFLIHIPLVFLNNFEIYFIRTQKRYNKMRYARTRRYSRVAFFVSLLALILVGQRLEWLFGMPTVYNFKIKWLFNYILFLSPIFTLLKINIHGLFSLFRILKFFSKCKCLEFVSRVISLIYGKNVNSH